MAGHNMASKIREKIVASAIRCFASKGYHGCSTKEIASRAKVTEGSLFRVCGSKDSLFAEALSNALSSKIMKRNQTRIVIFALLEGKPLDVPTMKAIRRASVSHLVIGEILKLTNK